MKNVLKKLLLESYIYHIDDESLFLQLNTNIHPTSVKAVSDTLNYFGVENLVVNVPKDELDQLPTIFLAVIKKGNTLTELVFVKIKKRDVHIITEKNERITKSKEDFKEIWTGIIIAIESGKKQPFNLRSRNKNALILLGLIILCIPFYSSNLLSILYAILTIIGLFISILIIRKEMGIQDAAVSKICNVFTQKDDCTSVLNTDNIGVLKILKLSDTSLVFFSSNLFISSFINFNHSFFLILGYLSLLFIVLSLYFQLVVLKKWCFLCLGIVSVLLTQFILLVISDQVDLRELNLPYLLKSFGIFLSLVVLWNFFKPLISAKKELTSCNINFIKFKRQKGVFDFFLNQNKVKIANPMSSKQKILFGNPDAKMHLKAITNPYCGFCRESFEVYDEILTKHGENLKLEFFFNVPEDLSNEATTISIRIIEIYVLQGSLKAFEAMKQWFLNRDLKSWTKTFGEITKNDNILTEYIDVLRVHKDWCRVNNINYTPVTIINNNVFPKIYKIKDLLLLIKSLLNQD